MYKQININIHDRVKGNTTLKFDPIDFISSIKERLSEMEKTAMDSYELKLGNKQLEDDKTLLDSGL